MKLLTLENGVEVHLSPDAIRKLSRKKRREMFGSDLSWPGHCQQCFSSLNPPDLTWCSSCGSSDEDET